MSRLAPENYTGIHKRTHGHDFCLIAMWLLVVISSKRDVISRLALESYANIHSACMPSYLLPDGTELRISL